jgi:hypothetical protein
MRKGRRRAGIFLALAALPVGAHPVGLGAKEAKIGCDEYCGERAAAHCEDLNSWGCTLYIAGCLAGCNIKKFLD